MIILQTVLQELRHLNLSVYRRMIALMKDETRQFIFFPNELTESTSLMRNRQESMNDANDRAIRSAAAFYNTALAGCGTVILISNDAENQRKAREEGINSMRMKVYIQKYLQAYPDLMDLLAADSSTILPSKHQSVYPAHLSMGDILVGLKAKRYLRGTIRR